MPLAVGRHAARGHARIAVAIPDKETEGAITATAIKIFRGERVGTIFGTISIGSGLGSALGSWSGGLLHDFTHSYNPLIVFSLINVVLGMLPFLVVPALRR